MLKPLALALLLGTAATSYAQNIYSALHMNENREFRNGKPSVIIETKSFYGTATTQTNKSVKTFDKSGMLLTEERFDEEGKLKEKLSWTNDTARRLKLQRVFERWTITGYSKETATYTYDDKGFLTRVTDMGDNGSVRMVSAITNNEQGHPVELRLADGNGSSFGTEKAVYLYDKNIFVTSVFANDGRQLSTDTQKISFRPARVFPDDKSTYNEQGDALSYSSKSLSGAVTLYECDYVYDATGNCIDEKIYKVTMKGNGKKKRSLDRHFKKQITYSL